MGKTVITALEKGLEAGFDKRFGRAACFCVLDKASGSVNFFENESLNAGHGAGTKAAEKMVEWGVDKIISGDFGPKAKELLEKFNVQMVVLQDDGLTVQDIINKLK
jgi:predicted Fe-Mo cluster-binding NifX family protein